ncbi:MAG: Vgb family protein [Gammaproteobacteria bacterium]
MHQAQANIISEFDIEWPDLDRTKKNHGSTHELAIDRHHIYVTGQNMHQIAKFDYQGRLLEFYRLPLGSGPHGILLDGKGRLWVSLEFFGKVVRLDEHGDIVREIDVRLHAEGANVPINPAPHGIGLDADGETIWFTGKRTSTVGKINPDGSVQHFQLNTLAAMPIYLSRGPDGNIWGTELLGNSILSVSGQGEVREFVIPTPNSRPIGVIADPSQPAMWFTEEAGMKIGKIDVHGHITEFQVPIGDGHHILASLAFDRETNLWVQVYAAANDPNPNSRDYLLKFDRSIREASSSTIASVPYTAYELPSRETIMHRIKPDYDGNLWFTELRTDKLGKALLQCG